jgi:predicted nucleic acid-binding Zn ribbon protein
MSRKDKIAKAATRTAAQARETAARERGRSKRSTSASGISPHRHCSVCWAPIPLKAEPPVCSDEECEATNEKRMASRKRLTIMLYLFPAIAILLAILTSL